jgi:hypothetical protein
MVHVTDDGIFDAPVGKIWRYISDQNAHQHSAVRFTKVLEQSDKGMTTEVELKNPDGSWHKETWKLAMNPPKSQTTEMLVGPMKGSKYTNAYTPMGNRTKVEVDGEFQAQGMDDTATKKFVLSFLEMVFNEDTANLKNYK